MYYLLQLIQCKEHEHFKVMKKAPCLLTLILSILLRLIFNGFVVLLVFAAIVHGTDQGDVAADYFCAALCMSIISLEKFEMPLVSESTSLPDMIKFFTKGALEFAQCRMNRRALILKAKSQRRYQSMKKTCLGILFALSYFLNQDPQFDCKD